MFDGETVGRFANPLTEARGPIRATSNGTRSACVKGAGGVIDAPHVQQQLGLV